MSLRLDALLNVANAELNKLKTAATSQNEKDFANGMKFVLDIMAQRHFQPAFPTQIQANNPEARVGRPAPKGPSDEEIAAAQAEKEAAELRRQADEKLKKGKKK